MSRRIAMKGWIPGVALFLIHLLVFPSPGGAQVIRGVVLDDGTLEPVAGVSVMLIDRE